MMMKTTMAQNVRNVIWRKSFAHTHTHTHSALKKG